MKSCIDIDMYIFKVNLSKKKRKKIGVGKYIGIPAMYAKDSSVIGETYNSLGYTVNMIEDLISSTYPNNDGTIVEDSKTIDKKEAIKEVEEFIGIKLFPNLFEVYDCRYKLYIDNKGNHPLKMAKYRDRRGICTDYICSKSKNPKITFRNKRNKAIEKAYRLNYIDQDRLMDCVM